MAKRLPSTPRSQVRAALRRLWLRSRERASALQSEHYTCEMCNRKQSTKKGQVVKLECHHLDGIGNWDKVIDLIFKELLCSPDRLQVLCKECHKDIKHTVNVRTLDDN
jgi:hypothetical protein